MKKIIVITLIILTWTSLSATPLGTEFTYQGELKDSAGNPHNGTFDFQFEAFDLSDANTGISLGFFVADDVEVVNGIFTMQIDFDGGAFFGDKVWLEISVRDGASTGGYTQLLPRQQVTATPYASHASFALNVGTNSVSTNEIINATIDTIDLANSSITSAKIADGTIAANDINSSQIQRRISASCAAGEFMQSVNQDGTPVCVAETGGITTVTTTEIVDGTIQAVDIDNSQVQQRVSTVCSGGRVVKSINATGVATCVFPTPSDNSVNSAKVTDGSIAAVDVDTSQIQQRINGSCIFPEYLTSVTQAGDVVCARMGIGLSSVLDSAGSVGVFTSIVIGADGNPVISYRDSTNVDLKMVKCSSPSCSSFNAPIALDSIGVFGGYTSIAKGTDGNPIISYFDYNNQDLKVVKCSSPSCSSFNAPIALDTAGDVGYFTSIAKGTDGNPIISYYDFTNGDLKVVKCYNSDCSIPSPGFFNTTTTLDSIGNVGTDTSIVIGAFGNPIISYYDNSNKDLKVVKCTNPSCSNFNAPIALDTAGDVGKFTSVANGANGNPIISYYDNTNKDLKVVKCTNPSCSNFNAPIALDTAGDVGETTSIAIGADGNPIISYYDFTNGDLKVVKCTNPSCSSFNSPIALDTAGDVGGYTSIVIGADDNPIISYYDYDNGDLKVYSCGDAACSR